MGVDLPRLPVRAKGQAADVDALAGNGKSALPGHRCSVCHGLYFIFRFFPAAGSQRENHRCGKNQADHGSFIHFYSFHYASSVSGGKISARKETL